MAYDPDSIEPDALSEVDARSVLNFFSARLLTRQETADALRIKPDTLSAWGKEDRGPTPIQIGRRKLYNKAQVEAFMAQNGQDESVASAATATDQFVKQAVAAEQERLQAIYALTPAGLEVARDEAIRTGMSVAAFEANLPDAMARAILRAGESA